LVILLLGISVGCPSSPSTPPSSKLESQAEEPAAEYLVPEAGHGLIQSPINIVTSQVQQGGEQVVLHYEKSKEKVVNLGHTIEVDVEAGNYVVEEGHTFVLKQFHFHTPSEHLLDGVTYPMELHLVHVREDAPTEYLVISALFKQGRSNPLLDSFIDQIPRTAGHTSPAGIIDLSWLHEQVPGYFQYRGSLTTPPYTETVRWFISRRIYEASPEQIDLIHELEGDNARHVQVFGERQVKSN
jgi:carbonic anhydrase